MDILTFNQCPAGLELSLGSRNTVKIRKKPDSSLDPTFFNRLNENYRVFHVVTNCFRNYYANYDNTNIQRTEVRTSPNCKNALLLRILDALTLLPNPYVI